MGKSRFIELMAKSIGNAASEKELKELEGFLERYPEYRKMQKVAGSLKVDQQKSKPLFKEEDIQNGLDKLLTKMNNAGEIQTGALTEKGTIRRITYLKWTAAAAVLIIVSVAGMLYIGHASQAKHESAAVNPMVHIIVPYGKTRSVVLSDGTRVRLNAGSSFDYPTNFLAAQREVRLEGEGFFQVTKNPKRPFLVHTQKLTVRVLGTVFNVKAYNDDRRLETTLISGSVQVQLNASGKKIMLLPKQKLTLTNIPQKKDIQADNDQRVEYQLTSLPKKASAEVKEIAWLDDKIVFTNENFEDVARRMERQYDVQIIFENKGLEKEQISGVLQLESLDEALQLLKMTTSFKFRIEGRNVYLAYSNNQP